MVCIGALIKSQRCTVHNMCRAVYITDHFSWLLFYQHPITEIRTALWLSHQIPTLESHPWRSCSWWCNMEIYTAHILDFTHNVIPTAMQQWGLNVQYFTDSQLMVSAEHVSLLEAPSFFALYSKWLLCHITAVMNNTRTFFVFLNLGLMF